MKSESAQACSTRAKRAAIVARIADIATARGATITMKDGFWGPKTFDVVLALGDYRMNATLGGTDCGAFLGHWFTETSSDVKYPSAFWRVGSLNTYHFTKATTCENTLDGFLQKIGNGLDILQTATVRP